jgi:hypothetical protein
MEKEKNKIDLEAKIFHSIEAKKIKMRPRWEFRAEKFGLESALVLTFLVIATLFCLLFLYSKGSEIHRLLEFGPDGWWYLLKSFPFEIFIVIATLLYLFNSIAKKLELSYKISRLYWYGLLALSFLILVAVAEAGGFHKALYDFEEETSMPLLRPYIDSRMHNIIHESAEGDILESDNDRIILRTEIGNQPTTTVIRRDSLETGSTPSLKSGDHVRIIRKPCQARLHPCLIYKKPNPVPVQ